MANYKITERTIKDKNGNEKGKKKCIIADMSKLTLAEREIVEGYMKAGMEVYPPKSKKTGNGLTKDKMKAELKGRGDEEGMKELEKMLKAKENFMRITSWYKKRIG